MNQTSWNPVCGRAGRDASGHFGPAPDRRPWPSIPASSPPDRFGTLVKLHKEFQRLNQLLQLLDRRQASALAYLASPGCNPQLGQARLSQIRSQRLTLLGRLRSHRNETLAFLSSLDRTAA